MASVSLMLRHFPYSSRMELGGLTASWDLITCSCHECHHAGSRLCGGMLTGSEVPDQKSVIRFRLTMSLSALPRSSREEERPGLREADSRATQIGALTLSAAANTKFSTKKVELTIKGPFTLLVFSLWKWAFARVLLMNTSKVIIIFLAFRLYHCHKSHQWKLHRSQFRSGARNSLRIVPDASGAINRNSPGGPGWVTVPGGGGGRGVMEQWSLQCQVSSHMMASHGEKQG